MKSLTKDELNLLIISHPNFHGRSESIAPKAPFNQPISHTLIPFHPACQTKALEGDLKISKGLRDSMVRYLISRVGDLTFHAKLQMLVHLPHEEQVPSHQELIEAVFKVRFISFLKITHSSERCFF